MTVKDVGRIRSYCSKYRHAISWKQITFDGDSFQEHLQSCEVNTITDLLQQSRAQKIKAFSNVKNAYH
jgi:hypothetical protein